jgi:hypothetical protein
VIEIQGAVAAVLSFIGGQESLAGFYCAGLTSWKKSWIARKRPESKKAL